MGHGETELLREVVRARIEARGGMQDEVELVKESAILDNIYFRCTVYKASLQHHTSAVESG